MGRKLCKTKSPGTLRVLGIDEVNQDLFCSIKNNGHGINNKPLGGLWTSPANSEYGWKEFVIGEDFRPEKYLERECFVKLKNSAKLFIIDSIKDLDECPTIEDNLGYFRKMIDWEKLSKDYDGIWLTLNGEKETRYYSSGSGFLLGDLYGWDVETVLLFNLNCIKGCYKKIKKN